MTPHVAYCYRSGVIKIGKKVPKKALPLAYGPAATLKKAVEVRSRHSYQGKIRLVPGIPEADTDEAALNAALKFGEWLAKGYPSILVHGRGSSAEETLIRLKRYRLQAFEHGKLQGFLCEGGKLDHRRNRASLLTMENAQKAKAIFEGDPASKARGVTIKIV